MATETMNDQDTVTQELEAAEEQESTRTRGDDMLTPEDTEDTSAPETADAGQDTAEEEDRGPTHDPFLVDRARTELEYSQQEIDAMTPADLNRLVRNWDKAFAARGRQAFQQPNQQQQAQQPQQQQQLPPEGVERFDIPEFTDDNFEPAQVTKTLRDMQKFYERQIQDIHSGFNNYYATQQQAGQASDVVTMERFVERLGDEWKDQYGGNSFNSLSPSFRDNWNKVYDTAVAIQAARASTPGHKPLAPEQALMAAHRVVFGDLLENKATQRGRQDLASKVESARKSAASRPNRHKATGAKSAKQRQLEEIGNWQAKHAQADESADDEFGGALP